MKLQTFKYKCKLNVSINNQIRKLCMVVSTYVVVDKRNAGLLNRPIELTDFVAAHNSTRMYVPVLMDTDVFQVLDYATPVRFTFEGVFEAFGTLIAQGPRVLLADGRVERLDDVCKRHTIVFVQLAQVWLLVVIRSVHGVRPLHRCGTSAETTDGPTKN